METSDVRKVLEELAETDREKFILACFALHEDQPEAVAPFVRSVPAREKGPAAPAPEVASMTILIHGTWSTSDFWYKPGSQFHTYIKDNVFPDVYCGNDYFYWSGDAGDKAHCKAAGDLVDWCRLHPAKVVRLIGHSHGANVANLATEAALGQKLVGYGLLKPTDSFQPLTVCTLVELAPPVWENSLPDMNNVTSKRFFNFHSLVDPVVSGLAHSPQSFKGTAVAQYACEKICAPYGHFAPVQVHVWKEAGLGELVKSVCV